MRRKGNHKGDVYFVYLTQHLKARFSTLRNVHIWQLLQLILGQPIVDLHFHSSKIKERIGRMNKVAKQVKRQHACYLNQICRLTRLVMKQ